MSLRRTGTASPSHALQVGGARLHASGVRYFPARDPGAVAPASLGPRLLAVIPAGMERNPRVLNFLIRAVSMESIGLLALVWMALLPPCGMDQTMLIRLPHKK